MLQIKTIENLRAPDFDTEVNEAIAEGWRLVKRYRTHNNYFVAELERETITEAEQCCENCRHRYKGGNEEPCQSCSSDADKWEPMT